MPNTTTIRFPRPVCRIKSVHPKQKAPACLEDPMLVDVVQRAYEAHRNPERKRKDQGLPRRSCDPAGRLAKGAGCKPNSVSASAQTLITHRFVSSIAEALKAQEAILLADACHTWTDQITFPICAYKRIHGATPGDLRSVEEPAQEQQLPTPGWAARCTCAAQGTRVRAAAPALPRSRPPRRR